jgi:hypothetical protein
MNGQIISDKSEGRHSKLKDVCQRLPNTFSMTCDKKTDYLSPGRRQSLVQLERPGHAQMQRYIRDSHRAKCSEKARNRRKDCDAFRGIPRPWRNFTQCKRSMWLC